MTQTIKFKTYNPRKNFPLQIARKRGESNFLEAFRRTYIEQLSSPGLCGKEFSLCGYGIADLIWIGLQDSPKRQDGKALTVEGLRDSFIGQVLTAFEIKLTAWRQALKQAYRYSYFADKSIVVMPIDRLAVALKNVRLFEEMGVGLWGFDRASNLITKYYTPKNAFPKNNAAREKAIDLIFRNINLCKLFK